MSDFNKGKKYAQIGCKTLRSKNYEEGRDSYPTPQFNYKKFATKNQLAEYDNLTFYFTFFAKFIYFVFYVKITMFQIKKQVFIFNYLSFENA